MIRRLFDTLLATFTVLAIGIAIFMGGVAYTETKVRVNQATIGGGYVPPLQCQEDEAIVLTPAGYVCYNIEQLKGGE